MTELTMRRRLEFFSARLSEVGECWVWTGAKHIAKPDRGGASYGKAQLWTGGKVAERWYAHRLSWFLHKGDIPAGLTIDHLCRNTLCVNPDHLDPVPPTVNSARAAAHLRATRPLCRLGHNDWKQGSGGRYCAECNRIRVRKNKERKTV